MKTLSDMRPVYVVGIGLHPYQNRSQTSYVTLGLRAVREALADAAITWPDVESAYVGNALIGMAAGAAMPMTLPMTKQIWMECSAAATRKAAAPIAINHAAARLGGWPVASKRRRAQPRYSTVSAKPSTSAAAAHT